MKRILMILVAGLFILSGSANAQTQTEETKTYLDKICGYDFSELMTQTGITYSNKAADIKAQINEKSFELPLTEKSGEYYFKDKKGSEKRAKYKDARAIYDPKLMCILLHELTGLEERGANAEELAGLIVDTYGEAAWNGKTAVKSKSEMTRAIKSGDAWEIIGYVTGDATHTNKKQGFYGSTLRISTETIPTYFDEYNGQTAEASRKSLATQINKQVTTINTVIVKKLTITKDRVSSDTIALLTAKDASLTNTLADLKDPANKNNCSELLKKAQAEAKALEAEINNGTIKRGSIGTMAITADTETQVVTISTDAGTYVKDEYLLSDVVAADAASLAALKSSLDETIKAINAYSCIDLAEEANNLYALKMAYIKKMTSKPTDCDSATKIFDYINSISMASSGTITLVPVGDEAVIYPEAKYTMANADIEKLNNEVVGIVAASGSIFKGAKTWADIIKKATNFKKRLCKEGGSADLDSVDIDGWFANWNLCNTAHSGKAACQQVILETTYDPDNDGDLSLYNLTLGNRIAELEGDEINQLQYYLETLVEVKNARTEIDQDGIDIDNNRGLIKDGKFDLTKAISDDKDEWEAHNEGYDAVVKAEADVASMKKYLLEDFYKGDAVKNLCFGFPVSTAAATNGAKAIITDLSKSATADETIAFFKNSNVINVNQGERTIQQLCVIYNRIKHASVTGREAYLDFAGDIVDVLKLNEDIDITQYIDNIEVTGEEAFKDKFADAMQDKDDAALIKLLSCLYGFDDIHDEYELGEEPSEDGEYTMADAITSIVKESAGFSTSPVTSDNDDELTPVNDGDEDELTPPANGGDEDQNQVADVSAALEDLIKSFLTIGNTDDEFSAAYAKMLKQYQTDKTDKDKLLAKLQELLTDAITSNDNDYWSTDQHKKDLAKVIEDAFAMKSGTCTAAALAAIIAADEDISDETVTRLTVKNADGDYSDKEFRLIIFAKNAYDKMTAVAAATTKRTTNAVYDPATGSFNKINKTTRATNATYDPKTGSFKKTSAAEPTTKTTVRTTR